MALAGAGTQSSSGHKPELDKLYCWHLEFLSSPSFLFSSSSSSFLSLSLCVWLRADWVGTVSIIVKAQPAKYRHLFSCAWSGTAYFTTHDIMPSSAVGLTARWTPLYGFTGICTHWAIIIMEAVTGNSSHIADTLCLIRLSLSDWNHKSAALTRRLYTVDNVTGWSLTRFGSSQLNICSSYYFHISDCAYSSALKHVC